MKIGAYSFAVSGDIASNLVFIRRAILQAAREGVRLLVFPECALTGYPPRDLPSSADVNRSALAAAEDELRELSRMYAMCIIAGSITYEGNGIRNSAIAFSAGEKHIYHKRALWGWDRDNFAPGEHSGVFEFGGLKIGMRICYEIRFPEYFRELYRANTDLNIVLFNDAANSPDPNRYDLIRAHIRTRAAENVCPLLAVNTTSPFQTASTMICDGSGNILAESAPGAENLLIHDLQPTDPNFSDAGRRLLSDLLVK